MVEAFRPRTTLASLDLAARTAPSGDAATVTLAQRPFLGKISLRGDPRVEGFARIVRDVTGLDLPSSTRTVVTGEGSSLLRLGPDEWLLVCAGLDEAEGLARRLSEALSGRHAVAIDVSSGYTALRLGGASAKATLQKGCTIDLDAPHFAAGDCTRTRLGNADVVLHRVEDDPGDGSGGLYDIYVPRSYAVSLWHWLDESSFEYGLAVAIA